VPGVRNANLDDAEVARLLSWLPGAMDPDHLPPEVLPFSAEEVGTLRRSAQGDVLARRAVIGELLASTGIALRSYHD
jgi:hypothetical protein